ncbi:MAG TPA: hypothetical protein DEF34_02270 [Desulfotomaculum sp.]|nr:hypothetical protein [Desulfotomaculum sp.]
MIKGMQFELDVFNAINKAVNEGNLGLIANACQVYRQKGYYSRDREKDIITDISIELYLDNSIKPSFIWVWECKDYRKSIPVDDIEEFHSKLEQIGADKTKGTVITSRGSFQSSALKYAEAKGIGVARLLPSDQIQWMIHFTHISMNVNSNNKVNNTLSALTNVNYIGHNQDFFGVTSNFHVLNDSSIEGYIRAELDGLIASM